MQYHTLSTIAVPRSETVDIRGAAGSHAASQYRQAVPDAAPASCGNSGLTRPPFRISSTYAHPALASVPPPVAPTHTPYQGSVVCFVPHDQYRDCTPHSALCTRTDTRSTDLHPSVVDPFAHPYVHAPNLQTHSPLSGHVTCQYCTHTPLSGPQAKSVPRG
eukprot:1723871-Rhodomonas_salina.1